MFRLELHYNTASGAASTIYPKSQWEVENSLKRLRDRHILADLIDAESLERIGGIDAVDEGKGTKWVWWYDADQVKHVLAHIVPERKKDIVTSHGLYEKEIAPLVQALLEKARKQNIPCLFAVQVEGIVRISGNLVNASPQMQEAFAILFQEEEPHNGSTKRDETGG